MLVAVVVRPIFSDELFAWYGNPCADLDRRTGGSVGRAGGDVPIASEYGGGGASDVLSDIGFADLLLRWEDDPGTFNVDVVVLCRVLDDR